MKVRISAAARDDLARIYLHGLREFDVAQAEAYQDRIDQVFRLLEDNPRLGSERRLSEPPVRVFPAASHLIVYRARA